MSGPSATIATSTDIFAIQDEISKAIVEALKVKLLPEEKKAIEQRGTTNVEAYKLYLMARQYWITGNYGDLRREETVMRICQRAIEIDPDYAQAWALMGIAQSSLRYGFGTAGRRRLAAAERRAGDRSGDRRSAIAPMACRLRPMRQNRPEADARRKSKRAFKHRPGFMEANKEAGRLAIAGRADPASRRTLLKGRFEVMENDYPFLGACSITCCELLGDRKGRGMRRTYW